MVISRLRCMGRAVLIDTKIDIHEINQKDVLSRFLHGIKKFFQSYSGQLGRIISIALALPGLVNSEKGIVMQIPNYNVETLP